MKLEDQVCSLELAKKLKELGIKNKSIFGWVHINYGGRKEWIIVRGTNDHKPMSWCGEDCKLKEQKDKKISAYTVGELGEILREFELNHKYYEIDHYNTYDGYNLTLKPTKALNVPIIYFKNYTEADVRASVLIYLLENKLMEFPE